MGWNQGQRNHLQAPGNTGRKPRSQPPPGRRAGKREAEKVQNLIWKSEELFCNREWKKTSMDRCIWDHRTQDTITVEVKQRRLTAESLTPESACALTELPEHMYGYYRVLTLRRDETGNVPRRALRFLWTQSSCDVFPAFKFFLHLASPLCPLGTCLGRPWSALTKHVNASLCSRDFPKKNGLSTISQNPLIQEVHSGFYVFFQFWPTAIQLHNLASNSLLLFPIFSRCEWLISCTVWTMMSVLWLHYH